MKDAGKIPERLNTKRKKLLNDIYRCHTEQCGMTVEVCPHCGHKVFHYGSCRNPNCPMCGTLKREKWIHDQEQKLVKAEYCHIIFTIPSELNPLCLADPTRMYNLLFESVAYTLKSFSQDKKFLGVEHPGFTCVLHTWGQTLELHPHIHVIFCCGGIDKDGKWKTGRKTKYLFPVKAVAKMFRGYFLDTLKKKPGKYLVKFQEFTEIILAAGNKDWNVEIREKYSNSKHVIEYLGRYVNRMAISNGRILAYDGQYVTFSYKDYRDKNKIKKMKLEDTEFLRRFLMHVPPKRFMRIRHYGFLGNNAKEKWLKIIWSQTEEKHVKQEFDKYQVLFKMFDRDVRICECCHKYMYEVNEASNSS
jgi:hypothetical protein